MDKELEKKKKNRIKIIIIIIILLLLLILFLTKDKVVKESNNIDDNNKTSALIYFDKLKALAQEIRQFFKKENDIRSFDAWDFSHAAFCSCRWCIGSIDIFVKSG